jgi:hypothetical protein
MLSVLRHAPVPPMLWVQSTLPEACSVFINAIDSFQLRFPRNNYDVL